MQHCRLLSPSLSCLEGRVEEVKGGDAVLAAVEAHGDLVRVGVPVQAGGHRVQGLLEQGPEDHGVPGRLCRGIKGVFKMLVIVLLW